MSTEEQRAKWRAASARYRTAHPEKYRASARAAMQQRRIADPSNGRDYQRAYRAAHPGLYASYQATRHAKQRVGEFTHFDWQAVLEEFDHRCAYCQAHDVLLEREHMLPLSRGGAHAPHNIVPACVPCNRSKGALTAFEFLARGSDPVSL